MKQIVLIIALLVSANACRDTSIERKQLYARVTANYHKCVERVKRDYNPKTNDAIALIARCQHWAIMTKD